jgi:predicted PhzF superfamily epimerase YddE/YHI9
MPAKTLKAFADHGKLDTILTTDGGDAEVTLRQFADSGSISCAGHPTSGRWRQVVCEVVERSDKCHFVQEQATKEGKSVRWNMA